MIAFFATKQRWLRVGSFAGVAFIVALIYSPVSSALFVWDDVQDFKTKAWLRYGHAWMHFLLRDFNGWSGTFRPLVVALFTLEVRLFDASPGPMHVVSLLLHVIDTMLVGLLAMRVIYNDGSVGAHWKLPALSMLIYGLHPVLIEPVVWIGCQFDLVATMFTLIGLLANIVTKNRLVRAIAVAGCFFLAACSKESAFVFPILVAVFDWLRLSRSRFSREALSLAALLRQQWLTYVGMLLAGCTYLALRFWALGQFVPVELNGAAGNALLRWQESSFLYLHYWRMLLWPMTGMSPIHPVDTATFAAVSVASLATDAVSTVLLVSGVAMALRHKAVGFLVIAASISLLPVLRLIPVGFDSSLYHERYAITSLSMLCVLLPISLGEFSQRILRSTVISFALSAVTLLWLSIAVLNIRVTIPLWSSQVKLWEWALRENPSSTEAKDELLSAYINYRQIAKAHVLINQLAAENTPCANCMLNAAILSLGEGNLSEAQTLLGKIKNAPELISNRQMHVAYLINTGRLLALRGNLKAAETTFRQAIAIDALDPEPHMELAMTLLRQDQPSEAMRERELGLALLEPDQRSQRDREFQQYFSLHPASGVQDGASSNPTR